jgi:pyridoxamine 5'-phosphate oxidase
LNKEIQLGSPDPNRVVLATASATGKVHSRIVAVREMTEAGILFFTQRATRKVIDLRENPSASMTLWLPLQQREVILDGVTQALTEEESHVYWDTLPFERQVKFTLHRSGKQILSLTELENEYQTLLNQYRNKKVPMSDSYCGYRLCPEIIYFYTLGVEKFSEVVKYSRAHSTWTIELISP